jgi:hypothetical protein
MKNIDIENLKKQILHVFKIIIIILLNLVSMTLLIELGWNIYVFPYNHVPLNIYSSFGIALLIFFLKDYASANRILKFEEHLISILIRHCLASLVLITINYILK